MRNDQRQCWLICLTQRRHVVQSAHTHYTHTVENSELGSQSQCRYVIVAEDRSPANFGHTTKCIIVTKGGMSIIWGQHAYVCAGCGRGTTACYNCLLQGKLTSNDTVAEMLRNWDLIKAWPSSYHRDAWNSHRIESGKSHFGAVSIVVLECSNC